MRKEQLSEDEARQKVSDVLEHMELKLPTARKVCNRVLEKSGRTVNGEKRFELGSLVDELARVFSKKGARGLSSAEDLRAALRSAVMCVMDPLGKLAVRYADTNWEHNDSKSAMSWPLLSAFVYDLVEKRIEHWTGTESLMPEGTFSFF